MSSSPRAFVSSTPRIAILGLGAIGRHLLASIQSSLLPGAPLAALVRAVRRRQPKPCRVWRSSPTPRRCCAGKPDLAIECAGHEVVRLGGAAPAAVRRGRDPRVAGRARRRRPARDAGCGSRRGQARLITVSGAIGGLDALAAARGAGLTSVRYSGRKPPQAWRGTPAEQVCDLSAIREATLVFEGSAADSARLYPKNANVTAAVALAGVGFDKTAVRLLADPSVTHNVHELEVEGDFGSFVIRLENNALPTNARTSWLAALSIAAELRNYLALPQR